MRRSQMVPRNYYGMSSEKTSCRSEWSLALPVFHLGFQLWWSLFSKLNSDGAERLAPSFSRLYGKGLESDACFGIAEDSVPDHPGPARTSFIAAPHGRGVELRRAWILRRAWS